jgi:hypothetical protein
MQIAQREQFISCLIESEKKLRALRSRVFSGGTDPLRKDFNPLQTIVEYFKNGQRDEAVWLAFLCIHFGWTNRVRERSDSVRLFYGKFEKGSWNWETVVQSPASVKSWMLKCGEAELAELKFGNHRKYETNNPRSPAGPPAVITSFVEWSRYNGGGSAWRAFDSATRANPTPEKAFAHLYQSLTPVKRFGRTAKFDFLCLLGNLGILDVTPGHCYLRGATGPKQGALLLVTGKKKGKLTTRVQTTIEELRKALCVSVEAMEDALCNWQKGGGFVSRMCGRPRDSLWVFGYGSLLWDLGSVRPAEERTGYLEGWHREWTWISKIRRQGAPTCSLGKGGRVKGKFLRLEPSTAVLDLDKVRQRERPQTEEEIPDVPCSGAVTYFWTMGSNLDEFAELVGLESEALLRALARKARETSQPGPDGVTAVEYIRRVHAFDPDDELTAKLCRFLG